MKLAVIGKTGQLARALYAQAPEAQFFGREDLDLASAAGDIDAFVSDLNCNALIIAAAYTAVDMAEGNAAMAMAVNANAPKVISESCAKNDVALLYVSTDYVFNGNAAVPYAVNAPTKPLGVYGQTKYLGEKAVDSSSGKSAVVRTSWVFDGTGQNFFKTMLRLAKTRDKLTVVADQIGRPTYAPHLAKALLDMLPAVQSGDASGVYHVTGTGPEISWADFARAIMKVTKNHRSHDVIVQDISTSDYPTTAARPAYSVLDTSRYEANFGALPRWESGLEEAYKEWAQTQI